MNYTLLAGHKPDSLMVTIDKVMNIANRKFKLGDKTIAIRYVTSSSPDEHKRDCIEENVSLIYGRDYTIYIPGKALYEYLRYFKSGEVKDLHGRKAEIVCQDGTKRERYFYSSKHCTLIELCKAIAKIVVRDTIYKYNGETTIYNTIKTNTGDIVTNVLVDSLIDIVTMELLMVIDGKAYLEYYNTVKIKTYKDTGSTIHKAVYTTPEITKTLKHSSGRHVTIFNVPIFLRYLMISVYFRSKVDTPIEMNTNRELVSIFKILYSETEKLIDKLIHNKSEIELQDFSLISSSLVKLKSVVI